MRFVRCVAMSVLVLLGITFVYARLFMYRGVPWDRHGGSGILSVERGTSVRTVGMRLDGNGLTLERNRTDYSGAEDQRVTWRVSARRVEIWNWCGTGRDGYLPGTEFHLAGFSWTSGEWIRLDNVQARPHFRVTSPHWLNGSAACAWPALALIGALRRRLRFPPGHCASCGYDLRATPDRCPECGAAPTAP